MHSHTHLLLHSLRSAELREHAAEFHLAPTASRTGLRTRLGWALVDLGLRILPRHPGRTPFAAGTA
ncbi:hypothetical protein ACIA74_24855 [Streptomyces sp. NPDC051658]|uniref:hypothetical protein n=1 Tax=unclassified Streptomyces TaxID=2593676 RepID=UPI00225390C9|nr:hypothetical protein [Streptomyces sp. NBC_01363]MCX4731813.1 hypothetical protein [Streptomyces sp. NBC_01363]WSX30176.1 hypothetical protein OG520_25360 [Streptomyces sp. NBC_00984]